MLWVEGKQCQRDGEYCKGGWGQKWTRSHCPGRESNPRCSRLQTNPRGPVRVCGLQRSAGVQSWGGACFLVSYCALHLGVHTPWGIIR